jgi:hypothetical protein
MANTLEMFEKEPQQSRVCAVALHKSEAKASASIIAHGSEGSEELQHGVRGIPV